MWDITKRYTLADITIFMISVEKALKTIDNNVKVRMPSRIELYQSLGLILAEDVISPINMPPFPQSAMDGYAVKLYGKSTFNLIGEVKAGDGHEPILNIGEAVRIFTGRQNRLQKES